jgi:hypothetical protein
MNRPVPLCGESRARRNVLAILSSSHEVIPSDTPASTSIRRLPPARRIHFREPCQDGIAWH